MSLQAKDLHGTYTALVTPFDDTGKRIDEGSLRKLIEFQLKAGVNGLVACGSTGEAACLTLREFEQMVALTREYAGGGVPVVAGLSISSTDRAVEAALVAKKAGADGFLVSAPPYNKPSQEGIYQHCKAIADATSLPIIAYNIPGRSCVAIQTATIVRMAQDGFAIGVKDATGSMDSMLDLLTTVPRGFRVLSGEDSLVWPLMSCGGAGTICACANVAPERFASMTSAARNGDYETARRLQLELLPLIRALFLETNPVPAKAALWLKGIIASPAVRLPLIRASQPTIDKLKEVLGL
jgi:4-hydroxy-tetrahydrodipicolinate synthase